MTDFADDDFFDDAKSEFPAKEDLKDRLVAIFAVGPVGNRPSTADPRKSYPYVETVTVVLDNGPDGTSHTALVPEVQDNPIALQGFQWSVAGVVARTKPRVGTELALRPVVGRINSMKNKKKGFSDAWSIAEPTDADKETVRKFRAQLLDVREQIIKARERADDLEPEFA